MRNDQDKIHNNRIYAARKSHDTHMESVDRQFTDKIYKLKAELFILQQLADGEMELKDLMFLAMEHLGIAREMLSDIAASGQFQGYADDSVTIDGIAAGIFSDLYSE